MNHFVFLNFYFGAKNACHGNSLVFRRVSQGRIIIVLFWTKYAVPRQIKLGILKLTTSRGQRNLCTVFIFVSCEEKCCYRIVSLGHQKFDCRSYCGLRRRMQGKCDNTKYDFVVLCLIYSRGPGWVIRKGWVMCILSTTFSNAPAQRHNPPPTPLAPSFTSF